MATISRAPGTLRSELATPLPRGTRPATRCFGSQFARRLVLAVELVEEQLYVLAGYLRHEPRTPTASRRVAA